MLQYEYPVQGKIERALDDLAAGFLKDTQACIDWIEAVPSSPYPPEMIVEKTGNATGLILQP